jgi:mannosyltransferase
MSVAASPGSEPATAGGADGPAGPVARRSSVLLAGAIGLVALFSSPSAIARLLVGSTSPHLSDIIQGAWLLKAAILAHVIALPALARAVAGLPAAPGLLGPGPAGRPQDDLFGTSGAGSAPSRLPIAAALAALLGLALALRLVDLGAGLWHDEIATLLEFGRLSPGEIVATYPGQNQHVLYSLLGRASLAIFGESTWALRLPAVVFGVASLGATYWFGTQVANRREAFLATTLLTVSYHHVWFSQDARGYTGLMLFACLSSGLLLRLMRGESARPWRVVLAYAATMALAAYTHLTAAFIAVAHGLVIAGLAWRHRRGLTRSSLLLPVTALILAATFTVTLYALVLPQLVETLSTPAATFAETPWRNPLWLVAETLRGASRGLPGGWIGLAGGLAVLGGGAASYFRRAPAVSMLMIVPVVLTGVALIGLGHNLWPRFFFFGAGFAALIAVRGVFALLRPLPGRWAVWVPTVGLALAAAASATTVPRAWAPKQDYAGALEWVDHERGAADGLAAAGLAAYAYDSWLHAPVTTVERLQDLEAVERAHDRTWLLYAFPTHLEALLPEVWTKVQREYRRVAEFPGTVAGGTVYVMIRP